MPWPLSRRGCQACFQTNVLSDVGAGDENPSKYTAEKHEASERDGRNVREVPAVLLRVPSNPSRQDCNLLSDCSK